MAHTASRAKRWQPSHALTQNDKATVRSLDELADRLERGSVDIGARIGWDTALTTPDNRLVANGAVVTIESYPELYAVYGITYGGNGVTTFGLPTVASTIVRSR